MDNEKFMDEALWNQVFGILFLFLTFVPWGYFNWYWALPISIFSLVNAWKAGDNLQKLEKAKSNEG